MQQKQKKKRKGQAKAQVQMTILRTEDPVTLNEEITSIFWVILKMANGA